jgi:hypothetical protein
MGRRLRKLRKWLFWDDGRQGATEAWSPTQSTARAGQSGDFDEAEIFLAFDKLIASCYEKPDYLREFEEQSMASHYYRQIDTATNYTNQDAKRLKAVLAYA